MSKPHASTDDRLEPGRYEIRLQGHLDTRWAAWFDGLSLAHQSDGTTVIYGSVVDQAALHGLLSKVRDLGLPLIAVSQVDPKVANRPDVNSDTDHYRCGHASANTQIKEKKMKTTTSNLIRWAGLSAVVGGTLFVAMQPIHPPEILSSVTTPAWAIVHYVGIAMCLLNLLGITGIYARQAQQAGWLGLAGFLLFGLMWALTASFQFAEALILPLLATEAPRFAVGFLGITSGSPSEVSLGILPAVYSATSVLYLFGGVLLGIATFRAGVLPRWAGGGLAVATVAPLALSLLLPHEFIRLAAVPIGVALVWLGCALWSERRETISEPLPRRVSPQLRPAGAD